MYNRHTDFVNIIELNGFHKEFKGRTSKSQHLLNTDVTLFVRGWTSSNIFVGYILFLSKSYVFAVIALKLFNL